MNNSSIVEDLARKQVIERIIRKEVSYLRPEHKDLAQDLYVDLLTKPNSRLELLNRTGLLKPFLVRMVRNNLHSSTSRFYYTYRKFGLLNSGEESKEYREAPWEDQRLS